MEHKHMATETLETYVIFHPVTNIFRENQVHDGYVIKSYATYT